MKAYEILIKKDENKKNYIYVVLNAMKIALVNDQYDKVEEIAIDAMDICRGYIDFYCYYGFALYKNNKIEEAKNQFLLYLLIESDFENSVGYKDPSVQHLTLKQKNGIINILVEIFAVEKNYKQALYYAQLFESEFGIGSKRDAIVRFYFLLDQLNDLFLYYQSIKQTADNSSEELKSKAYEILEDFYNIIEGQLLQQSESKWNQISDLFQFESTEYGLLNRVRHLIYKGEYDDNIIERILMSKTASLNDYYAPILFYLLLYKLPISKWMANSYEQKMNDMFRYLLNCIEDKKIKSIMSATVELRDVIIEYVQLFTWSNSLNDLKIKKSLMRYIMAIDNLSDNEYHKLFLEYIDVGKQYIYCLYSPVALDNEEIYHMSTEEEGFFLLMDKAQMEMKKDPIKYMNYLKRAINLFELKRGIKLLMDDFEKIQNEPTEMDVLKRQLKANIYELIQGGKLNEAQNLIEQYLSFMPIDEEILYYRSEILLNAEAGLKS